MARHTPRPPATGPDFGPGGSSPQRTAPRRGLRALRALGWLLVGSVTLALGLGAGGSGGEHRACPAHYRRYVSTG